ncbi:MAG: LysR family transcriptional regulator [Alphaproteobacteria bacterium]|nr:LysR family transcriptional regulator [Alphaproteobacteria bacterium]
MDWTALEAFVAVAERRSFTAAAEALGVSRSVASRRVSSLEEELGVQLLLRSTRHVDTTTAGRRLLGEVGPLLSAVEAAVDGLPEAALEPAGELRITAPADLAQWMLPSVLGGLVARYPALHPVVVVGNRVVDLEREGFDVALRVHMGPPGESRLRARRLGPLVMGLFGAPSYLARRPPPSSLDDLAHHVIVGGSDSLPEAWRRATAVAANDMLLAAALARHGVGLAALPTHLAREAVASGELVRLLPDHEFGRGALHLVFSSARVLPPKLEVFRDAVLAFLEENPLEG